MRIKALLLTVLLLVATPLWARTKFQGYATRGGQTFMTTLSGSSASGMASYPLAQYDVFNAGTSTPATIFSDLAGTPKVCPCTTDAVAFLSFYGDSPTYDVRFSGAGIPIPWTQTSFGSGSGGGSGANIAIPPPPSGGDDFATIQTLINANSPLGITIVPPDAEYLLSAELCVPATAHGEILHGIPGKYDVAQGTRFKLTGSARSCLTTTNAYRVKISGITFDANRLGTYAVYLNGFTWSSAEDCNFLNGITDGLHLGTDPNLNDTNTFTRCFFVGNGTLRATTGVIAGYTSGVRTVIAGTCTTIAGNATITFAGAPDLTTLGIRRGELIRIHFTAPNSPQVIQVESVAATTITAMVNTDNKPQVSAAGLDFAIGLGAGYYEERATNNNVNHLIDCVSRGNPVGLRFDGLYGPVVDGGQIDFNSLVAICVSVADNNTAFIGAQFSRVYTEANTAGQYFLGQSQDVVISAPNSDAAPFFANPALNVSDCTIIRKGRVETLKFGADQSFVIQVTRTAGGVLQHRIISDLINQSGSAEADKINGFSNAYANTPTLDPGNVAFVNGAGIFGSSLVLDTAAQGAVPFGILRIEDNTTGANVRESLSVSTVNINGVTQNRTTLRLLDATGAEASWPASIGNGTTLAIRAWIRIR